MKYYLGENQKINAFSKPLTSESNSLSMAEIKMIAASGGLHLEGVKLAKEDLYKPIYPAIVTWGANHFAVLLRNVDGFVFVADPLSPIIRVSIDEFFKKSNGYALILQKGGLKGVHVGLCVDRTEIELNDENKYGEVKFYNFGDKPERLFITGASCSCIEAWSAELDVQPGEDIPLKIKIAAGKSIQYSKDMVALKGPFPPFNIAIINILGVNASGVNIQPSNLDYSLQRSGEEVNMVIRIEHPIGAKIFVANGKAAISGISDVEFIKIRPQLTIAKIRIRWKDKGYVCDVISFNADINGRFEELKSKITAMVY